MKMYAYLILAVLVAGLLLQPLTEVLLVCRDTLVVNSAANNAVRAAKKECYIYDDMKNAKTGIDEAVFKDEFAKIFAAALELETVNPGYFTPKDESFNEFYVDYDFDTVRKGDRLQINVNLSIQSEYKFKTKLLAEAEQTIREKAGMFFLTHDREYNLILVN